MRPGPQPRPTSVRSRVLAVLQAQGGTVRDIAKRAGVHPPMAKHALEGFEGQGRAACDRDARPRIWSAVP